ncbi:MAG: RibD family protein [Pedosphaera sp.]|nr:RibD family protein [Pedosphaera sp.]
MSPKSKVQSPKSSSAHRVGATGQSTTGRTLDFRLPASDLPFVLVNMAMTADGKIATANRAVSSFGSARDHEHLLALRATADAVMCGARTVNLNKINLGPGAAKFRRARLKRGLAEFNLRVVVSGSGSINPSAEVFQHRFSPIIVLTTSRASESKLKKLRTLADAVKVCGKKEINFRRALRWLQKKWKVNRLLCEGGGELNDALFRAGLVDELHLTVCPRMFGGRSAPTISDGSGFAQLAGAAAFELKSSRRAGGEIFLTFQRKPPPPAR